jgi:hypothetical protein
MVRLIFGVLCVMAAAGPAVAELAPGDISGRWEGENRSFVAPAPQGPACEHGRCKLTLDIVRCAGGWCGIEVGGNNVCGATALKLDAGTAGTGNVLFTGRLELARGTEPYVVQAYLLPASGGASVTLHITGDTGGEFRIFRRSFPFQATLARTSDAACRAEQKVSAAN